MNRSDTEASAVLACFCNTGFSTWGDSAGMCRRCNHPIEEFIPRAEAADLGEAWSKADHERSRVEAERERAKELIADLLKGFERISSSDFMADEIDAAREWLDAQR